MDKLMDNRWFMKIIALLLAILLYSAVPDNNTKTNETNNLTGDHNTETIQDVPVKSVYDTENLVISGVPNTVDVTIQGPLPNVQAAKALKNFEVYVDLAEIKIGNHTVPIKIKDISNKLKVQIDPAYANITVQEKVTKVFEVEAEYDTALLEEGFEADKPLVEPKTVQITGAKETIERITYVKATLDIKDQISETITREAKVRVLDRELNKLDVVVEPDLVEVTIPVKSVRKTVPIKIVEKGSTPEGIILESIQFVDTNEAIIVGPTDLIANTESVRVEVDMTKISEDTTLSLPVIISDGITKVTPKMVEVKVDVTKMEEKVLSGIGISSQGLSDNFEIEYHDPPDAAVNLTVIGTSEELAGLSSDDFQVFVDLSDLSAGLHVVEIKIEGPDRISWKVNKTVARISITEKDV
jgi:YbbR domain-containing protein